MLYEQFGKLKYKYWNRKFWCRGYYVDTMGKNRQKIAEYIRRQLDEDKMGEQMTVFGKEDSPLKGGGRLCGTCSSFSQTKNPGSPIYGSRIRVVLAAAIGCRLTCLVGEVDDLFLWLLGGLDLLLHEHDGLAVVQRAHVLLHVGDDFNPLAFVCPLNIYINIPGKAVIVF